MNTNLTQLSDISQVIAISEVKTDKNGREFKTLRLSAPAYKVQSVPGIGEVRVKTKAKQVSVNAWKESYLDSKPSFGWDAKINDWLSVGIFVATNLEPYEITDTSSGEIREVTSRTFAVEEGTNPDTQLKNDGYTFESTHDDEKVKAEIAAMVEEKPTFAVEA